MACILLFSYGRLWVNSILFSKAIQIYDELLKNDVDNGDYHIYKACCYYALCKYDDARR